MTFFTIKLTPNFIIVLVFVSFDPVSYTVTEGVDGAVELILVRSGDLSRATVLTITTADGSAIGMMYSYKTHP